MRHPYRFKCFALIPASGSRFSRSLDASTCPSRSPHAYASMFDRNPESMKILNAYLFPPLDGSKWMALTHRNMLALVNCLETGDCKPNQDKGECIRGVEAIIRTYASTIVVILGSYHFRMQNEDGWNAGEQIWARSTVCSNILACFVRD